MRNTLGRRIDEFSNGIVDEMGGGEVLVNIEFQWRDSVRRFSYRMTEESLTGAAISAYEMGRTAVRMTPSGP